MAWTTTTKVIDVATTTPHPHLDPSVVGRAPTLTTVTFSPLALFGACARCSHLFPVDPALVTPESIMIASLVERHVDNAGADFAILSSADGFKDYIKSYFAGTVASGIAYLTMIQDGYVWADHYENFTGGNPGTLKTPDFVFSGPGRGLALMESKGTRSATSGVFATRVEGGYVDQVEPHLGFMLGQSLVTHGFCIGSYMTSSIKAELQIHHTATPVSGGSSPQPAPAPPALILRNNYATAFTLAHSQMLGEQVRRGDGGTDIPFLKFEWNGRSWLSSYAVGPFSYGPGYFWDHYPHFERYWHYFRPYGGSELGFAFAIEEKVGLSALHAFLRSRDEKPTIEWALSRMEFDAERGNDGAVFPDGLAILRSGARIKDVRPVIWSAADGSLRPA